MWVAWMLCVQLHTIPLLSRLAPASAFRGGRGSKLCGAKLFRSRYSTEKRDTPETPNGVAGALEKKLQSVVECLLEQSERIDYVCHRI